MTVALLVITDGRIDYLHDTVDSARENLRGLITRRVMYDDTGDSEHRAYLRKAFPDFDHIHAGDRQGFGGAIRASWAYLTVQSREPFIFHLEQDFTFNRPVNLDDMADLLISRPHLAQLALRRQSWNAEERAAGGIIEQHPTDYAQNMDEAGHCWIEHRRFFTTNPSLYRRTLMAKGWPDCEHSEGIFTHELLRDPKLRFAFWGLRTDEPWVEHIGHERAGTGY